LNGASCSVDAGEFVCILGPSGCGKSTLLNILSGLDQSYEGVAPFNGRPVREQLNAGFRVGYVFQEPRLMPADGAAEHRFALARIELSQPRMEHVTHAKTQR